jgi:hypothetical protein
MKLSDSYGTSLAPRFAQSYIDALMVFDDPKRILSYAYLAGRPEFETKEAFHNWLRPLYPYLSSGQIEALDYSYVRLLVEGIRRFYKHEAAAKQRQRQLGKLLVIKGPPIWSLGRETSLQSYFSQGLAEYAKQISESQLYYFYQREILYCEYILKRLAEESGIAIDIQRSSRRIDVRITSCPFCHNQRADCTVWIGVVEGLLIWLLGEREWQHSKSIQVDTYPYSRHCFSLKV